MKWAVLALNILTIGILGYTVYMQYVELSYYRGVEEKAIASYKPPVKADKGDSAADSSVVTDDAAPSAEAETGTADADDSASADESPEASEEVSDEAPVESTEEAV